MRYVILPLIVLALSASPALAEDELPPTSEFFDEYDANADGRVTQEEFRGSSEIFRLLDKNGDGEISPDELGLPADYKPDPAVQKRRQQAEKRKARGGDAGRAMQQMYDRIMKMDADGDGRVSAAEWKGKEQGFARLDRNKDGFLDGKDGAMAMRGAGERGGKAKGRRGKGKDGGGKDGRGKDGAHDSAAMLEQMKKRFARTDANGDGKITADELPAERFLAMMDKNKDGAVDEAEFLAFAKQRAGGGNRSGKAGRSGRRGRLNAGMLRRFDRNKDGKVDADEFPGREELFARMDANKDGVLDEADIAAAKGGGKGARKGGTARAPTTPRTGNVIERGDTDGDGRLNRAEFLGSAAEWRALDKNGDGWVTADEIGAK